MKKVQFVIGKLVSAFFLLFGITLLSFILIHLSPGNPAEQILKKGGVPVTQKAVEAKRHELGLDRSLPEQYVSWVFRLCRGDMGESYESGRPVFGELLKALPYTLMLGVVSLLLIVVIATPLGIWCAWHKDGPADVIVRFCSYLLSALPSFFIALLLMYVCSLKLQWFPVIAKGNRNGIVMPALVLSLTLSAWYIRQVRAIALAELQKDYVTGLRSRGVSERKILFGHVLRNCLSPFATLFGLSAGSLLGGAAIVESIYTWPGLGKLAVDGITARDYPMIQGYVVWMAAVFFIVNSMVDIFCMMFDPRVRRKEAPRAAQK